VQLAWFKANNYAWGKHVNGVGPRPKVPAHITQAEFPGFFDEMARFKIWRQRKQAGVLHPALGLWAYGRLPEWAIVVSRAMDAARKPAPGPEPPSPVPVPNPNPDLTNRAQKVIFTGWNPLDGVHGRLAITADVNVAGNPDLHRANSVEAAKQTRARGFEVAAWANQSQVGIQNLVNFGNVIGAAYLIWQAETPGEMVDVGINLDGSRRADSPCTWGPIVVIGNANAWTDKQRAAAKVFADAGRLAFIQETYANEGDPWPDRTSTQGVPACAVSPGVGWGRYPHQLPAYHEHMGPGTWLTMSPYIGETMDSTSWATLPW